MKAAMDLPGRVRYSGERAFDSFSTTWRCWPCQLLNSPTNLVTAAHQATPVISPQTLPHLFNWQRRFTAAYLNKDSIQVFPFDSSSRIGV
jgi:hypothetical protein